MNECRVDAVTFSERCECKAAAPCEVLDFDPSLIHIFMLNVSRWGGDSGYCVSMPECSCRG